jgi:[protein-PII] uridylyltransferase
VREAVDVADHDLRAATGLLDARHLAGDVEVTTGLLTAVRAAWRSKAPRRLAELHESCRERWATHGEVAHLLEPDLKQGRGGLRDVAALRAIATAQVVDVHWRDVRAAYDMLLDARDALHLVTGRATAHLLLQEQDAVAAQLDLAGADLLAQAVAIAARRISFALDMSWQAVERWTAGRRRAWSPRTRLAVRRPLAQGVVEQDGEVGLARDAEPAGDPVLGLRVAAAAARADLPIAPHALQRLRAELPALPEPWSEEARNTLVTLLGSGPPLVRVIEAIDQYGLLDRALPEWTDVRCRPQRNPVHRYTVDRHLIETAVAAAAFTRDVTRPDLLLLSALFHDIGKGQPGDHTANGVRLVGPIASRIGLPRDDTATLVALVRHHLLLPETATRRDLDDPATIDRVLDAVDGSVELLDLLHALTKADAAATGPAAWSDWKASLVAQLVHRARALAAGADPPAAAPPDTALLALASGGATVVEITPGAVVVAAGGGVPVLSSAAGALSLNRLDVLGAAASTVDTVRYVRFDVRPRFGSPPDPERLRADVRRALCGQLDLEARLAERERAYARSPEVPARPRARVLWFDDAATGALVLELRAADSVGLLHRVTAALERCGAEVRSARVATLGAEVVDAFYLAHERGHEVDRDKVEQEVLAAAER